MHVRVSSPCHPTPEHLAASIMCTSARRPRYFVRLLPHILLFFLPSMASRGPIAENDLRMPLGKWV